MATSTLSNSVIFRIRLAAVALFGLGIAASATLAAPVRATDIPAPTCSGGSKPVCKKPICDGIPIPKCTGCSEWQCEMSKTKLQQSLAPRGNRPSTLSR